MIAPSLRGVHRLMFASNWSKSGRGGMPEKPIMNVRGGSPDFGAVECFEHPASATAVIIARATSVAVQARRGEQCVRSSICGVSVSMTSRVQRDGMW